MNAASFWLPCVDWFPAGEYWIPDRRERLSQEAAAEAATRMPDKHLWGHVAIEFFPTGLRKAHRELCRVVVGGPVPLVEVAQRTARRR